ARAPRRVLRMGFRGRFTAQVRDFAPDRRLRDEVDVGVGIVLPALALQNPAGLAAAGIVAGAWRCVLEWNVLAVLAVFCERAGLEPLLVAQLDTAKVEHAVLHGG